MKNSQKCGACGCTKARCRDSMTSRMGWTCGNGDCRLSENVIWDPIQPVTPQDQGAGTDPVREKLAHLLYFNSKRYQTTLWTKERAFWYGKADQVLALISEGKGIDPTQGPKEVGKDFDGPQGSPLKPNTTGSGPRRAFASEADWMERSKAEILNGLKAVLKPGFAEISQTIDGDATGCMEVEVGEWVTVAGEGQYFFQSIPFLGWFPKGEVSEPTNPNPNPNPPNPLETAEQVIVDQLFNITSMDSAKMWAKEILEVLESKGFGITRTGGRA